MGWRRSVRQPLRHGGLQGLGAGVGSDHQCHHVRRSADRLDHRRWLGQEHPGVLGDFVKNGTTQYSYTYERQQQDVAVPIYELFPGNQIKDIALPLDPEKTVETTINVEGIRVPTAPTSRASGASDITPSIPPGGTRQYEAFRTAANLGNFLVNGTAVAGPSFLMSASVSVNTNNIKQPGVGYKAGVGFTNGEIGVSGNLSA